MQLPEYLNTDYGRGGGGTFSLEGVPKGPIGGGPPYPRSRQTVMRRRAHRIRESAIVVISPGGGSGRGPSRLQSGYALLPPGRAGAAPSSVPRRRPTATANGDGQRRRPATTANGSDNALRPRPTATAQMGERHPLVATQRLYKGGGGEEPSEWRRSDKRPTNDQHRRDGSSAGTGVSGRRRCRGTACPSGKPNPRVYCW